MPKPGKKTSDDSPAAPLPRTDWDFDNVPPHELRACVYWEYARESAFLRDLRKRCLAGLSDDKIYIENISGIVRDMAKIHALGMISSFILRDFFNQPRKRFGHPHAPPVTGQFPGAWQAIPVEERAYRANLEVEREVFELGPFERADGSLVFQLAKDMDNQMREISHHPMKPETRRVRQSLFPGNGAEVGLFKIEWAHHTNEELRAGFGRWLATNRPPDAPGPDHRGQRPRDLSVALDRLAIMRLRHRHTLRELRERHSEIWRAFADFDRIKERKRARETFRKLLHTLPEEMPCSWPMAKPAQICRA